MTGWRIGMAVGNATLINALFRDQGQRRLRASTRRSSDGDRRARRRRRTASTSTTRSTSAAATRWSRRCGRAACGCSRRRPASTSGRACPTGFTSAEFAARLIEDIGVVVTPGNGYGQYGEGYVRLSITAPDERVDEGARRMLEWSRKNAK